MEHDVDRISNQKDDSKNKNMPITGVVIDAIRVSQSSNKKC